MPARLHQSEEHGISRYVRFFRSFQISVKQRQSRSRWKVEIRMSRNRNEAARLLNLRDPRQGCIKVCGRLTRWSIEEGRRKSPGSLWSIDNDTIRRRNRPYRSGEDGNCSSVGDLVLPPGSLNLTHARGEKYAFIPHVKFGRAIRLLGGGEPDRLGATW